MNNLLLNQLSINNLLLHGKFEENQLKQIKYGIEDGLDVSIYINPKIEWTKMREIRKGLLNDNDLSIYLKDFNYLQIREIRLGLEQGLDVSIYAKLEFNWQQMRDFRKILQKKKKKQKKDIYKNNLLKNRRIKLEI